MTARRVDVEALVDEVAVLWPELAAALERDQGATAGEKVATSGSMPRAPVNVDVLRAIEQLHNEIPATARWCAAVLGESPLGRDIPTLLRHIPRWHQRMSTRDAVADAAALAGLVWRWRAMAKSALGLLVPDRRLGQFCPGHDEHLVELVTPGDEGWLRWDRVDEAGRPVRASVTWTHTEAVLCRHCGTAWAPAQYLLLGRLLRDADRRRVRAGREADREADRAEGA